MDANASEFVDPPTWFTRGYQELASGLVEKAKGSIQTGVIALMSDLRTVGPHDQGSRAAPQDSETRMRLAERTFVFRQSTASEGDVWKVSRAGSGSLLSCESL